MALARTVALRQDQVGLALSGGGIRSATFALGVLQGLAQLRLLGMIDYLSTVSGGGYIGAWFSAWVYRENSLANVEKQLNPGRVSQAQAKRFGPGDSPVQLNDRPRDPEPEPVHHLRAYSRYLSPRFGPFSADTWTLFTIYLRNLFVNSLFLLPLAVAFVFFWRFLLFGLNTKVGDDVAGLSPLEWLTSRRFWLTAVFVLAFLVAAWNLLWQQENLYEADQQLWQSPPPPENARLTHGLVLLPLLIVALVGPWIFSLDPAAKVNKDAKADHHYEKASELRYFAQQWRPCWLKNQPTWAQFTLVFAAIALIPILGVHGLRWGRRIWLRRPARFFNWSGFFGNMVLAGGFGAAPFGVFHLVIWPLSFKSFDDPGYLCLLHAVGMPLVFAAMVAGGFLEMALVGGWLSEHEREWRSRVAAYLLMGAAAWLLVATGVLLLPWAGEQLFTHLRGEEPWSPSAASLKALLGAAWAAISGGGAWAASREKPASHSVPFWQRALMTVAPPVFLLGLLGGVSSLGQDAILWAHNRSSLDFLHGVVHIPLSSLKLIAVSAALVVVFGGLINVNRFSMHVLYANRLVRCYLGASRRKPGIGSLGTRTGVLPSLRQPDRQDNRFTGFDPDDDLPLADLQVVGTHATYPGPLLLVNFALNCLAGDELAYQDRRADAFLLAAGVRRQRRPSPTTPGRPATHRNLNRTLTLGRVMTISGAAVDPNMGGLSPPLTALMTLFNTASVGGWEIPGSNEGTERGSASRASRGKPPNPASDWPLLWEFLGMDQRKESPVRPRLRRRPASRTSRRLRADQPPLPFHHCHRRRH